MTITATDNAGVSGVEYRIGAGPWVRYTAPVLVPTGSAITYCAVDVNGNIEATKSNFRQRSGPGRRYRGSAGRGRAAGARWDGHERRPHGVRARRRDAGGAGSAAVGAGVSGAGGDVGRAGLRATGVTRDVISWMPR